jgi:hypothetical protein
MKCPLHLKNGNIPDNFFDKKQLRLGTLVEKEHTNTKCIAEQIAKAHLKESPDYYIDLARMEKHLRHGR